MRAALASALRIVLGVYVAGLLALALSQRQLLYPAGQAPPPADVASLRLLDARGGYRGLVLEPATAAIGTIVFFHGNAGTAADRLGIERPFLERGWRLVLAEYPGYGSRGGERSEASFRRDGAELLELVAARWTTPRGVWVVGASLGAAVAATVVDEAAQRGLSVGGVVLITPWSSLVDLAREMYWFYPVSVLLRDRYDSATHLVPLKGRGTPRRVVVAGADTLIPPHHGLSLCRAVAADPCITLPEASHLEWFAAMTSAHWDAVLASEPARPAPR